MPIHTMRKMALFLTLAGLTFTLSAQPQTPEQAVVLVGALEPRKPPATGFLISPDGYILTAAHVVCGSTQFRVRLEGDASPRNDPQQWREARLVPIKDEQNKDVPNPLIARDLALLKIEGQQLPFLRLGDSDQVRRGDAITAIGYPSTLGGIQATTQGTVTNTGASRNFPICDGNPELKNLIVTDVPITQGNSGGPLLRRNERTGEREVIGIVNGIAALALATTISTALEDFLPRQVLPPYRPEITSLEFPSEFFQGQKVEGRVVFWDANRDVAFAFVEVVELGGRTPVSVQQCCPQVFGKLSGEIRFTIEIPVTPSAPEQLTLRVTLLDLAGNQSKPEEQRFRARLPKPEIIEIDFPREIRADRQPNLGTVKFKDPNADVELARFDRVEGPFEPFVINLRERGLFGKSEGIIDFTIRAQEAGRVTVQVALIDAKGLRSEPKEFSFVAQSVGPPPQPPVIRVEPDRLSFSATVGGANPPAQTLTITNAGGGTLSWTARVVNVPWLALSATRGTAPSTITASVNITGLTASPSPGLVLIEAPGAQNSPAIVTVTLTLTPRLPPPPSATPVGTLFDYTGGLAEFGPPFRNAAELAAQHLNEAARLVLGGPLIRLIHEDSGTTPSTGVDRARKLVNVDRVPAIVGSLASGVTIPVAESVTVPARVLQISPSSTSPLITTLQDNDYLFRTKASDAFQGVVLAQLAAGEIISGVRYRTASVLYVNNAYGQGLSEQFRRSFERRGGRVLAIVPHADQSTYVSELNRALAGNPDVLVCVSHPAHATVYLREALTRFGYRSFLFVDGTQSEEIIRAVGAANLEGSYGTAQASDTTRAQYQNFVQEYRRVYGTNPPMPYMDSNYDAVVLIGLAIAKAHLDRVSITGTAVRDRLRSVANPGGEEVGPGLEGLTRALQLLIEGRDINYEGAAGSQDFDANGDVKGPIAIWQYAGGTIRTVRIVPEREIPWE